MAKKTTCSISRQDFREHAKPMEVIVNGKRYEVPIKEFSTGSLGWYLNDKLPVEINGKQVVIQLGYNMTILGSKEIPLDDKSPKKDAPATETPSES